jgi:hypothetical protein
MLVRTHNVAAAPHQAGWRRNVKVTELSDRLQRWNF